MSNPSPPSDEARYREAVRLHMAGQVVAAEAAYLPLLSSPRFAVEAASNLCAARLQQGDVAGSERYGRIAVERGPNFANGWNHLGLALKTRGAVVEAEAAFRRATELDPRHAMAFYNLGELLARDDRMVEAIQASEKSLAIEPGNAQALTSYIHRKQQIADFGGLDSALAALSRRIAAGDPMVDPFALLFCCADPAEMLKAARNAAASREAGAPPAFAHTCRDAAKIRIGYVSANFYDHAVGTLICQLLESHDRSRFEVHCYCHSAVKTGARRERIKRAADRFVEIDTLDDLAAARRIHDDGIDILVDLMGYTRGQRLRIFAFRPAPVQVTWIGYAGTLGGSTVDYIVADRITIPPADECFYTEAPVRMPVCYQVNDATRAVSTAPMSRADFGIAENAVVFCCFNQTAKITPPVLALWAQILKAVPDSLLWLWALYPEGEANLVKAFAGLGGDPSQLRFGKTLPEPEHLTRYGLCDLFLDTFPYGGHATASNALFGGCPLLALPGRTFASRVSASLLTALGLNALIANSEKDYVAKAVRIGRDRELRGQLKSRLADAARTSPLFDGARFANDIERGYAEMIRRYDAGEKPTALDF